VTLPVYNEERALPVSVPILHAFLGEHLENPWTIVIVDNGSQDSTLSVARALTEQFPRVDVLHLDQKGRGRALRHAWLRSEAAIVSYMDIDLSTELEAFPRIVALIEEGADLAIGSRLARGARVEGRSLKREVLSRGYNLLIHLLFSVPFSDAQCGFKAVRRDVARALLPLVQDQAWFFDTELLLLAVRFGYRIAELPVTWRDDPDSRVRVLPTVWEDLKGLWRLRWHPPPRPASPAVERGADEP
jgi:glycosyltransferase involved in cell wall biosynthesis